MGGLKSDIFLTTDADISRLHKRFLEIGGPTDVMAFQCGEGGEVVISLDTAVRQARQRRIPLRWELTLLAVHGILHLSGMRDHKLADWKKMRVAEFEAMVRVL